MPDILTFPTAGEGGMIVRRFKDNGDGTFSEQVALGGGGATAIGVVDTELPPPAALSDAAPNPSTPTVGAALLAWSGAVWRRALSFTAQDGLLSAVGLLNVIQPLVYNGATWDMQRTPRIFKPHNALSVAAETTIWTPAAGKKFRLMGGMIASSVAGNVVLRDNAAGVIIAVVPCLAGQPTSIFGNGGNGILSAAANNVLTATGPAASALSGTVFGTEE